MNVTSIAAEHAARLAGVDSLLPVSRPQGPDTAGTLLAASTATGSMTYSEVAEDSPDALWRSLVEHRLSVSLATEEPASALDSLLAQWEHHLDQVVRAGDWDTAAVVLRPSRDSAGSAELLRHGFAPVRVIAVRPADRLGSGPATTPGVCIRPATHDDLRTAVALQLELQRYDADFGIVTPRPHAERTIAAEIEELLAGREASLWIAELYGQPLGMVQVQLPPASSWIAPYVAADQVGYLASLNVAEAARSTGVGTALAAHAHQVFDEAGVDVVLLHHALANPRSTPFWYAQGYRPLWTYWYRRPAVR